MEVSADAVDALPTFQLNELVAELGDVGDLGTEDLLAQLAEGAAAPLPGGGEATEAGSRAAADFWRCAQEAGFRALCEALSFSGLQQELPRLFVNGVTVIAPSDAAFAQLSPAARGNFKLVRQLLLAHICPGTHLLEELQSKACAVSLAGQFEVDLVDDRLTVWEARLFEWNFDEDSRLHGDLAALADRAPDDDAAALVSVVLRVHFPDDFPFAPPLVYVASPPLTSEYIFDGALCMEMLVDWQPQYGNVDSMLVQIAAFLACSARVAEIAGTGGGGNGAPREFSEASARKAYERLQKFHEQKGWGRVDQRR